MNMITCSNCSFQNPPGNQLCDNCGQPLLMTQMMSQVSAPKPQPIPVLTQIGASPVSGGAQQALPHLVLVPFDEKNVEIDDPGLWISMPPANSEVTLGWNYYPNDPGGTPNIVDYDLQNLYPWIAIETQTSIDIAVSRRSAVIRTNAEGLSFFRVHEKMRTSVWANPYGGDRIFIPPTFEIPVVPGTFIFMGKDRLGVTFIVREV